MYQYALSVIIPVYNKPEELGRTLDSIVQQTVNPADVQVVIADDGSSADIRGILRRYPNLNISYCSQPDQGFRVAAARNLGIQNAGGEILVFNDNGIFLTPDTLETHIRFHKEAENLLLLGCMYGTGYESDMGKIRDWLDSNSPAETVTLMEAQGGMGDGRTGYMEHFGTDMNAWYIPWLGLWGGHFSVKKPFLEKHGIAFDENFTSWGGEDNEFGIQLCNAGAVYRFCPEIKVVHYPTPNRANSDITTEDFRRHYEEVKAYIAQKHPALPVKLWRALGSSVNDAEKRAAYLAGHPELENNIN